MQSVPDVDGVHHIHIWSLSSSIFVLNAHIYSCERDVARIGEIKRGNKERLDGFRILHSTPEFECAECTESVSSDCILTPAGGEEHSRNTTGDKVTGSLTERFFCVLKKYDTGGAPVSGS